MASINPPPLPRNSTYTESVTAILSTGVKFEGGQQILFGDSPQDVCSEIGPPSKTAVKTPERTSSLGKRSLSNVADYFFSYSNRCSFLPLVTYSQELHRNVHFLVNQLRANYIWQIWYSADCFNTQKGCQSPSMNYTLCLMINLHFIFTTCAVS